MPLVLHEKYKVDHRALDNRLSDGELVAILKFLRQRGLAAMYAPAAGKPALTRHYNRNGGVVGAGNTRRTRMIALSDHYEADIRACYHAIIRSVARGLCNPLLQDVTQATEYIKQRLMPYGHAAKAPKAILQRMITTNPEAIQKQMVEEFGVRMDEGLKMDLCHFHAHCKHRILRRLHDKGLGSSQDMGCNPLYRACEAGETALMLAALQNLLNTTNVKSLVWLHDGMYVHKSVPQDVVEKAFQDAAVQRGMQPLTVKYTDCAAEIEFGEAKEGSIDRESILEEIRRRIDNEDCNSPFAVDLDKPMGRLRTVMHVARRHNADKTAAS